MASRSDAAGRSKPGASGGTDSRERGLKSLGKYSIKKKIGAGGMGTVFLAVDTQLKRTVALKVLPKDKATNPTLVKRFKAEAQAAAHLKHENIVTVFEAGEDKGFLFIALEYVEGTDVHNLFSKRGPIPVKRSIKIIKQVALALQHAYEQNIVHRDIKPANLLVQHDGIVKLTDMGLARSLDESAKTNITRADTTVGTVDYMAPEQARNSKAADTRSDIYSLGCTWFHMLTGRAPFPRGDVIARLSAHATEPLPDPRVENKSVPETVVAVLHKMMAKSPAKRYQTPSELLEDLQDKNLKRRIEVVSNDELGALATEDDSVGDGDDDFSAEATEKSDAEYVPFSKRKQAEKRNRSLDDVKSKWVGLNAAWTKYVVIAVVSVGFLSFLGWLSQQFSDQSSPDSPIAQNPFDQHRLDPYLQSGEGNRRRKSEATDDQPGSVANAAKQPGSVSPASSGKAAANNTSSGQDDIDQQIASLQVSSIGSRFVLPPQAARGRKGEQAHFFDWVDESSVPVPREFLTLTVGFDKSDCVRCETLQQALSKVPQTGAIIELAGSGPYFLKPLQLARCETVVVKAAGDNRPTIVLVPEANEPIESLIELFDSTLTLDGIDLALVARQFPSSNPLNMVAIDSGHFAATNCSFSLIGKRRGITTAVALFGSAAAGNDPRSRTRALFSNVVVRGDSLSAIDLDQTRIELLTSNCLFVTGSAPVVTLTNRDEPRDNKPNTPTVRVLRFLSTCMCSSESAFEFRPGFDADNPPKTLVFALNSIIAKKAEAHQSGGLISLIGWPQEPSRAQAEGRFKHLGWSTQSSIYCGWEELVEAEAGSALAVRDISGWQRVWAKPAEEMQIQTQQWPDHPLEEIGKLKPLLFDAATLTKTLVNATDGNRPGCLIERLHTPFAISIGRAEALARHVRPDFIPLTHFTDKKTLFFNMAERNSDLGRFIEQSSWSDGSLIVAYGSGKRETSPISIQGKSLRIEFEQSEDGPPLEVGPRVVARGDAKAAEALFVVNDGTLEIVNANIRFPSTSRRGIPEYCLSVTDGSFRIRNSTIVGSMLEGGPYTGLIRWKLGNANSRSDDVSGRHHGRHFGEVVDSFLATSGELLEADMRERAFYMRNSIAASTADLFDFSILGFELQIAGVVSIRRSTLSAVGSFVRIQSTKLAETATHPLSLFVEDTVFSPPMDLRTNNPPVPALLVCETSVREKQQIDWWGHSNGYAPDIQHFLRSPTEEGTPVQELRESWQQTWPSNRITRPLSGPDGVFLKLTELPHRTKILAASFALHTSSKAYGWGPNEMPIGADVSSWHWKSTKSRNARSRNTQAGKTAKSGKTGSQTKKVTPKNRKSQSKPVF